MRTFAIRSIGMALISASILGHPAEVRSQVGVGPGPGDPQEVAEPAEGTLPGPPAIPEVQLGETLQTIPIRRNQPTYNEQYVDPTVLPKDNQKIWVLDFSFKPLRIVDVEIPGKGRRKVHYMYYRIINRSGKPRMFVPQFTLVTDTGKRYEDDVLPEAVKVIQAREDPSKPLLGAVSVMGMLPPSTKEGIDDAIFGVAAWEGIDPAADRISVYVRGLSDGFQAIPPPEGGDPVVRYKTLRIDFIRRGDERNIREREIQLLQPPYEWIYW